MLGVYEIVILLSSLMLCLMVLRSVDDRLGTCMLSSGRRNMLLQLSMLSVVVFMQVDDFPRQFCC